MRRTGRSGSHRIRWAFVVGTLLGCGGKQAAQTDPAGHDWTAASVPVARTAPFVSPGERATFRVTAHKVELASFVFAVAAEPTTMGERRAIAVQAGAQTAGIAALVKNIKVEFTSWLDVTTGQALLFQVQESAGKGDDTVEVAEARFTELADGKFPVIHRRPDTGEVIEHQVTAGTPSDLLGLLVALRGWEGKPGEKRVLDAVRNRYIWRLQVTLAARENVVTELGEFPAVRFEAASRRLMRDGTYDEHQVARTFAVWISDDADRVPVRLVAQTIYGDIEMDIVDYVQGIAPNLARSD